MKIALLSLSLLLIPAFASAQECDGKICQRLKEIRQDLVEVRNGQANWWPKIVWEAEANTPRVVHEPVYRVPNVTVEVCQPQYRCRRVFVRRTCRCR